MVQVAAAFVEVVAADVVGGTHLRSGKPERRGRVEIGD
jgi:hypothetical protein